MAEHADGLTDLVTRAHIARRLHLSRAGVARAVDDPGFPAPVGRVGASVVWRWAEVRAWAEAAAGQPGGPTEEALHVAGIRDHFREAGFRLRIIPHPDGGWQALRIAVGRPTATGQPFRGDTQVEAAEAALDWLRQHK